MQDSTPKTSLKKIFWLFSMLIQMWCSHHEKFRRICIQRQLDIFVPTMSLCSLVCWHAAAVPPVFYMTNTFDESAVASSTDISEVRAALIITFDGPPGFVVAYYQHSQLRFISQSNWITTSKWQHLLFKKTVKSNLKVLTFVDSGCLLWSWC